MGKKEVNLRSQLFIHIGINNFPNVGWASGAQDVETKKYFIE
jgi:hypothetical protein